MLLMEQSGPGDETGFRRILLEQVGDMPDQGFDRQPNPSLEARIEGSVLRLQPPFASPSPRHGTKPRISAASTAAIIGGSRKKRDKP